MVSRRRRPPRGARYNRTPSPVRFDDRVPRGRDRERSPEFLNREEDLRLRDEERRRMHWEEGRRERYRRSRSRDRDLERIERRERHSRSRRRSRSIDERGARSRFEPPELFEPSYEPPGRSFGPAEHLYEPPELTFEHNEFERRRRSSSMERHERQQHSSQGHQWMDTKEKYLPSESSILPISDMQDSLNNAGIWRQMQPKGPETSTPIVPGNQGFPRNANLGAQQNLLSSSSFMEGQDIPQTSGVPKPENVTESAEAPLVPEFNPDTSKLSSFDWIKLIETAGKERDWKRDEKHYIMTSRLGGFARQWYLSTGIKYKEWNHLKEAFLSAFPSELEFCMLLEKMMKRKKEERETVAMYFHHKVALLNACDIHGAKAVSCIIGGLDNPKIQALAKAQNCKEPDSLYMFLRSAYNPPDKKELEEAQEKKLKTCYYCRDVGHVIASCPLRTEKRTKLVTEVLNKHSINSIMYGSLSRKTIQPQYFTEVCINGVVLKGYFDQGSENTTIREENAVALKLAIKKQYRVIKGFSGSSISSTGIIDISLRVDRAVANVHMYVVPDHIQAIPVILGKTFTEQPHILIMKENDKMRFYQRVDNGKTNFDIYG